uniref:uncharacterized protein LOC113474657 n=1 Tax=Ciona intestinalis TaxID=7719 RepID=UPI000EF548B7|nr:uncharacterized protein LOC113474657 [Ciona intestinalis]|eukprot:XP_026692383.1 uncharacterized protein LOC113474657 [Ciona intestinalis]
MYVKFTVLCVLIGSLLQTAYALCRHNTQCTRTHDLIQQSYRTVTPYERRFNYGRSWYIQPALERPKHIFLRFSNYHASPGAGVTITSFHKNRPNSVERLRRNQRRFTLVKSDVTKVVVFVSFIPRRRVDFNLLYYAYAVPGTESRQATTTTTTATTRRYYIPTTPYIPPQQDLQQHLS